MKLKYFLFLIFLFFSCNPNWNVFKNKKISIVNDIVFELNESTILSNPIILTNNQKIIGNNATLIVSDDCPTALSISGVNNVKISNLNIKYVSKVKNSSKENQEQFNRKKVISIINASNIIIDSLTIEDIPYRAIRIEGSSHIQVLNSQFSNIGEPIIDRAIYSADGIFVGGRMNVNNVLIKNCNFTEMGGKDWSDETHNDADGIHLQSTADLFNVVIDSCTFIRNASRGVKVQSGNDITVSNSKFIDCLSGVTAPMANPVSNLKINSNKFINCKFPVGSNSIDSITLTSVIINNNYVLNCENFFRTNGKSSVEKFEFSNNIVENINTVFMNGRFKDGVVKKNIINRFATINNPSLNMAVLLAPESENIRFISNNFIKSDVSNRLFVNRSKSNSIKIENNKEEK
jgi:hypothetical protein